jgi:hypothetical protein
MVSLPAMQMATSVVPGGNLEEGEEETFEVEASDSSNINPCEDVSSDDDGSDERDDTDVNPEENQETYQQLK